MGGRFTAADAGVCLSFSFPQEALQIWVWTSVMRPPRSLGAGWSALDPGPCQAHTKYQVNSCRASAFPQPVALSLEHSESGT